MYTYMCVCVSSKVPPPPPHWDLEPTGKKAGHSLPFSHIPLRSCN